MSAQIIDGKALADALRGDIAQQIAAFTENRGFSPALAVIQVGDDPASTIYVRNKQWACAEVGIRSIPHKLKAETTQAELSHLISELNADNDVHGILLQLPLPRGLKSDEAIQKISPDKDIDGLHPCNSGLLLGKNPRFVPCTPQGCLRLIHSVLPEIKGLDAVVVGRSILVGKPLALLLTHGDATVTLAHSQTVGLPKVCRKADILIAAVGVPGLIQKEWVKPGAVVIDVGMNRVEEEDGSVRLMGDVNFDAVGEVAGFITPVPKGVGPMTIACLLYNTLRAAQKLT